MVRIRSAAATAAGLMLALSACGGSGYGTVAPGEDGGQGADAQSAAPATAGATLEAGSGTNHASEWDVTKENPCRLVSAADVTAIVGRPSDAGSKLASWPPLCKFTLQPDATLLYVGDNSQVTAVTEYDQLRNSGQAVEPVSGVGDQAYWVPDARTLHILVGRTHVKVIYAGPGVPAVQTAEGQAISVAKLAVSRL